MCSSKIVQIESYKLWFQRRFQWQVLAETGPRNQVPVFPGIWARLATPKQQMCLKRTGCSNVGSIGLKILGHPGCFTSADFTVGFLKAQMPTSTWQDLQQSGGGTPSELELGAEKWDACCGMSSCRFSSMLIKYRKSEQLNCSHRGWLQDPYCLVVWNMNGLFSIL